jgi:2-(1,2-epoxy-1,2-dihydrophenyl)acetyl-CoA isomerase
LTGEAISADQAAEWGLIWKSVDDAQFLSTVDEVAEKFARGATRGLAAIKRSMQAAISNSLETQLDLERDAQRELGLSEDYREGVAAFIEKRAAIFKGK